MNPVLMAFLGVALLGYAVANIAAFILGESA